MIRSLFATFFFSLFACSTSNARKSDRINPPYHSSSDSTVRKCSPILVVQRPTETFVFFSELNREQSFPSFFAAMVKLRPFLEQCADSIVLRMSDLSLAADVSSEIKIENAKPEPFVFRQFDDVPPGLHAYIPPDYNFDTMMLILVNGPAGIPSTRCIDEERRRRTKSEIDAYEKRKQSERELAKTTKPDRDVTYVPFPKLYFTRFGMIVSVAIHWPCEHTYYFRQPTLIALRASGRDITLAGYKWPPNNSQIVESKSQNLVLRPNTRAEPRAPATRSPPYYSLRPTEASR